MALFDFPPLHTARLTLRPVQAEDLADLLRVNGDDSVTRFLPYATWAGLEDGQAWLHRMQALQTGASGRQLVLVLKATREVIGTLLIFKFDAASQRAELGYVLGRAHWGRGLMFEAVQAACTQALGASGLRRLEAEVDTNNLASNALLQRLGFTREGTLRQRWVGKGRTYDTHLYGLLAGEPSSQQASTFA